MSSLPKKISQLMTNKKINAVDIERETGLNRNTVYSIVAGSSKNPSAQNLQLIAQALGVTLESILMDEEEMRINSLSEQQMQAFAATTSATVNIIVANKLNFSLDKLISIIREVYKYTLKATPPSVDERFIDWLLDKYKD
ncbi:helix-turn-helix transcriptional regulator [Rickettsiaceae bacterium]|jgi:transcriptional regulator with XRE-family HTH domain|nr:helix-turn-helix transcriptional regulator [Rickettsiaceae bacterium]